MGNHLGKMLTLVVARKNEEIVIVNNDIDGFSFLVFLGSLHMLTHIRRGGRVDLYDQTRIWLLRG